MQTALKQNLFRHLVKTIFTCWNPYSLPYVFTVLLFWHQDIGNFMFSLSLNLSLNLLYFVSFFLESLAIIEIGINYLCITNLSVIFYLLPAEDIGNIMMLSLSSNDDVIKFDLFCQLTYFVS